MKKMPLIKILILSAAFGSKSLRAKDSKEKPPYQSTLPLFIFYAKPSIWARKISLTAPSPKPFQNIPLLKIVESPTNPSSTQKSGEELKIIERPATLDYVPWYNGGLKASEVFNPLDQLLKK